jgi:conjugal transfer pilus assembly protein TraE
MKLLNVMASWQGAQAAARVLMVGCCALSVALVALSYVLMKVDRTVVMVAPDQGRSDEVSQAGANRSYLEAWAFHLASTLGNVTPDNVAFVKDRLAPLLCPSVYRDAMVALSDQASTIQRERVSISFEPRLVLYEEETNKIFVNGLAVNRAVMGTESRYQRTFEFVINIRDYRVEVCGLQAYEGGPRTEKVLAEMKQREVPHKE